jgi:hypothetical protein
MAKVKYEKFKKIVDLEREERDGDIWVKRLIQEEVFYSPEESLCLSANRLTSAKNRYYHTNHDGFSK